MFAVFLIFKYMGCLFPEIEVVGLVYLWDFVICEIRGFSVLSLMQSSVRVS